MILHLLMVRPNVREKAPKWPNASGGKLCVAGSPAVGSIQVVGLPEAEAPSTGKQRLSRREHRAQRRRPAGHVDELSAALLADTLGEPGCLSHFEYMRLQAEREGRVLTFQKNIRPLEAMTPERNGHRLLDVGAHVGVFVEVARERGWDAWGVEPSRWAVEQGRKRGLNMIQGTLHGAEFDSASFDVVTMWDVVEHLPDPMGDIREALRILKPGGILCLHTIDVESRFARLMGKRWPWLVEMHMYFFSPRTLSAMVERAGLHVESWRVQGRYLHLGYLLSRLSGWVEPLGRFAEGLATALHVGQWVVPVNFGDLFTLYASKPT